jgi:hypothetical protein
MKQLDLQKRVESLVSPGLIPKNVLSLVVLAKLALLLLEGMKYLVYHQGVHIAAT